MGGLKLLYFHQHFSTPQGSAGTRSYEMARAAIRVGHQITMVCGSYGVGKTGLDCPFKYGKRSGFVDGIKVIEFELSYSNRDSFLKRTWLFICFAFRSTLIAMTHNYDVVFATSTPLTAGVPGIFARWLRRKKFVFEVRDLWPELPKAMGVISNPIILTMMSLLEWVSYKSAHRLVGLSPGICAGIISRGISKSQVSLVPNGCDLEIFDNDSISRAEMPEISDQDFLAVFTGTHGQANGLDAVLDAASKLKEFGEEEIKILLIGAGKLKTDLQYRAKSECLDNVVFKNPVPKDELAKILRRADLGMQILANVPAFYYGTSPNKFFDYLSAGLPVLNNYPGWLAELILKHKCGYAIEPNNPELFARTLIDAKNNRPKLKLMGENAKALAKNNFDRSSLSSEWIDWVTEGNKS